MGDHITQIITIRESPPLNGGKDSSLLHTSVQLGKHEHVNIAYFSPLTLFILTKQEISTLWWILKLHTCYKQFSRALGCTIKS